MNANRKSIVYAVLAALLYGMSTPLLKPLTGAVDAAMLSGLLYLGAGLGMAAMGAGQRALGRPRAEARLSRADLPAAAAMVVLDIAAPVALMAGLARGSAAEAALLGNFEIVSTSLVAALLFREAVGLRQWAVIALVCVASAMLSTGSFAGMSFSAGSLLVLLAAALWGLENNCTRLLSLKDPAQVVVIKGIGSGLGALALALALGQHFPPLHLAALAMLLGFVCYGLSIFFYVRAQRDLGASRASAYYALAPFLGVAAALALLREPVTAWFWLAAVLMAGATALAVTERHGHAHVHAPVTHEHAHSHDDAHHGHAHGEPAPPQHSHAHCHEALAHDHEHLPDAHHHHNHK